MCANHRSQPPLNILRLRVYAAVVCLVADARDHGFQVRDPRLEHFQPVCLFDVVALGLPRFVSSLLAETRSTAGLLREQGDLLLQVS